MPTPMGQSSNEGCDKTWAAYEVLLLADNALCTAALTTRTSAEKVSGCRAAMALECEASGALANCP